jgi:hypothetical protein
MTSLVRARACITRVLGVATARKKSGAPATQTEILLSNIDRFLFPAHYG